MNTSKEYHQLADLKFDNRFTNELPADPDSKNHRRQVLGACYSRVQATRVAQPKLVAYAWEVAEKLNLSRETCESEEFAQVFAGNQVLTGMDPYAICYGGHQFGQWAGQLGDGRAINLGEVVNAQNERWVIQLKGAGPTPYSRSADGLAVLRSSVREFLCSEAMHHLGVPTTRALSLILTGEQVRRDMFYDGNSKLEPGAVVCRVSPSFIRFGNFEILASRGEFELLQQLVDYTVRTDFPHLGKPGKASTLAWFAEVSERTAEMIVHWMRVGFVHGVMNTDNMSILGLTIDYGPYGWLDNYDPDWTPNTTDASGRRYRFGHQGQIALWNLIQLAKAIYPLIKEEAPFHQILEAFPKNYEIAWQDMMTQKLGLNAINTQDELALITELQAILALVETDMTTFYRRLALITPHATALQRENDDQLIAPLLDAYYEPKQLTADVKARIAKWIKDYRNRLNQDSSPPETRQSKMNHVNPKYVLRNYLAQLAIDKAEQGDFSMVKELLELFRHPYDEQVDKEEYAKKRPDWARQRPGCSMLSCSS